jgi:hypothetical protein
MFGPSLNLTQITRRILSLWVVFLGFLNVVFYLPHDSRHFMSWVNFSLYFFLGVLALYIVIRDKMFRDVFAHYAFTYFFTVASIIIPFTGPKGLFGDVFLNYYLSYYSWAVFYSLLLIGATYLTLRYIFWRWPKWINYLIALSFGIFLNMDFWHKALTVTRFPFKAGLPMIYSLNFRTDGAMIILLILYCMVLLISHRPNGAFIHFFVVGMLLAIVCDVMDLIVTINQLDVYGLDQYFSSICNLVLIGVFFLRLVSLFSPEYVLREQFMFNPRYGLSTPVILKDQSTETMVELIKSLFSSQNILFQLTLGSGLVLISALTKSWYVTVKLTIMVLVIAMAWNIYYYFVYAINKEGQVLNKKFIK